MPGYRRCGRFRTASASKIGGDITLLVLGSQAEGVANAATKINGVKSVLYAKDAKYDHLIAEDVTELLVATQNANNYSHILAPRSNAAKNYIPLVGAKLDASPISDIIQVTDKDTFFRPTYAGNAIAQIKSNDKVKLITVRPTGFEKASALVHRLFDKVQINPEMPAAGKDAKTELQEWLQGRKMKLPQYEVMSITGAAHRQTFEVQCAIGELALEVRGFGSSRRAAEQEAAGLMLKRLKTPVS